MLETKGKELILYESHDTITWLSNSPDISYSLKNLHIRQSELGY